MLRLHATVRADPTRQPLRIAVTMMAAGLILAALPPASPAQDGNGRDGNGKAGVDTVSTSQPVRAIDRWPDMWKSLGGMTAGQYVYAGLIDLVNLNSWQHGKDWSPARAVGYMADPFGAPASDFECLTRNGCWPVEASHYFSWAAMGAAARLAGHGPLESWLLTGVYANWLWEYGVEGMSQRPSGHDLLIDAASAAAGIGLVELGRAVF